MKHLYLDTQFVDTHHTSQIWPFCSLASIVNPVWTTEFPHSLAVRCSYEMTKGAILPCTPTYPHVSGTISQNNGILMMYLDLQGQRLQ